jgi:hypothetical protein
MGPTLLGLEKTEEEPASFNFTRLGRKKMRLSTDKRPRAPLNQNINEKLFVGFHTSRHHQIGISIVLRKGKISNGISAVQ